MVYIHITGHPCYVHLGRNYDTQYNIIYTYKYFHYSPTRFFEGVTVPVTYSKTYTDILFTTRNRLIDDYTITTKIYPFTQPPEKNFYRGP
jgi:hypothetical protein